MASGVHEQLSKIYGTEQVKLALPAGVLGALFGAVAARMIWQQQADNRRQAEQMTQAIRAQLARRNAPIYEGFRSGSIVPTIGEGTFDDEMTRVASAIGADLALYKEAGIGGLGGIGAAVGGAAKKLMGGMGKLDGAMGRGLVSMGQSAARMPAVKGMASLGQGLVSGAKQLGSRIAGGVKAAPGAIKNWASGRLQNGSAWGQGQLLKGQNLLGGMKEKQRRALTAQYHVQDTGRRLEQGMANMGARARTAMDGQTPQAHAPKIQVSPRAEAAYQQTQQLKTQAGAGKLQTPGTPASPPAAPPPMPQQPTAPAGQPQPMQGQQPVAQSTPNNPTASTQQAGQQGPAVSPQQTAQQGTQQPFWDRAGLSNDRWKYKLPMLAAGGLGAYGLYRAGRGAFNWLGQEPHPEPWGNPYLQPAATVNEWGYAQR